MKLRLLAAIWSIGLLGAGCQSQEAQGASLSLKREARDERRALYDEVELIAGSGADEDDRAHEEDARHAAEPTEPAEPAEPAEPDASIEDRVLEEMGWADDSGLCGNGVVDEGERCDYAILEGEGTCPDECDPEPGCPDETLVVRGCMTYCMQHEEPSDECLAAQP
jgi:hypothetical protein